MASVYVTLLTAIRDRIVAKVSAFSKAAQIEFWPDEASDEIAPSERIVSALAQSTGPRMLISYSGGGSDDNIGGDDPFSTVKRVTIRFATRSPAGRHEDGITGDGTGGYFGVLQILDDLEKALVGHVIASSGWEGIQYDSDYPIALGADGKLAHALRLKARFVVEPLTS